MNLEKTMRLTTPAFWFSATLGLLVGCGGDGRVGVNGTVEFDGKPLEEGTIQFLSEDMSKGGAAAGGVIKNGNYAFKAEQGLPPGRYKVQISSGDPKNLVREEGPPGESSGRPVAKERLPAEFNSNSKVVVEVGPGKATHNFKIPKK